MEISLRKYCSYSRVRVKTQEWKTEDKKCGWKAQEWKMRKENAGVENGGEPIMESDIRC